MKNILATHIYTHCFFMDSHEPGMHPHKTKTQDEFSLLIPENKEKYRKAQLFLKRNSFVHMTKELAF